MRASGIIILHIAIGYARAYRVEGASRQLPQSYVVRFVQSSFLIAELGNNDAVEDVRRSPQVGLPSRCLLPGAVGMCRVRGRNPSLPRFRSTLNPTPQTLNPPRFRPTLACNPLKGPPPVSHLRETSVLGSEGATGFRL